MKNKRQKLYRYFGVIGLSIVIGLISYPFQNLIVQVEDHLSDIFALRIYEPLRHTIVFVGSAEARRPRIVLSRLFELRTAHISVFFRPYVAGCAEDSNCHRTG